MLILSRKPGESILIGEGIEIKILEIDSNQVKIGINAPKSIKVIRSEILQHANQENLAASQPSHSVASLKITNKDK